jgi:membrane protein required for colicin V production
LNWFDFSLVAIIILGAVKGFREGFLMELLTLIGIVLGILAGFKLMGEALVFLTGRIDVDDHLLPYIAFAVVFLLVLLVVTLIGKAVKAGIDKTLLGKVDQAAGAVLGIVKMVFILSVALWIVTSLKLQIPDTWIADSALIPYVSGFAPAVTRWVGEIIPAFGDIF